MCNEDLDWYRDYLVKEKKRLANEIMIRKDEISEFKNFCKGKGIILHDEDFEYTDILGLVACKKGIVTDLVDTIELDKDALVDWSSFKNEGVFDIQSSGYLFGEKFSLFANRLFRRGFYPTANYAPNFLNVFWGLNIPRTTSYLSLDLDRVRVGNDHRIYFESDTWFGPKFCDDISLIKDGVSKLRPPLDIDESLLSFFFNDAYSLDIKWSTKGNIKTFQLLEFFNGNITVNQVGETLYPARYIHAEFDLNKGLFVHFDGAVQFFTESEYYLRRDSDFNHDNKSSNQVKGKYEKLFKINGEIQVKDWLSLCGQFCTSNPLIIEYFTGKYPDYIEGKLDILRNAHKTETLT